MPWQLPLHLFFTCAYFRACFYKCIRQYGKLMRIYVSKFGFNSKLLLFARAYDTNVCRTIQTTVCGDLRRPGAFHHPTSMSGMHVMDFPLRRWMQSVTSLSSIQHLQTNKKWKHSQTLMIKSHQKASKHTRKGREKCECKEGCTT